MSQLTMSSISLGMTNNPQTGYVIIVKFWGLNHNFGVDDARQFNIGVPIGIGARVIDFPKWDVFRVTWPL